VLVTLTGPESCGKTSLAQQLAHHFGVPLIPERAREYLSDATSPCTFFDLRRIAAWQWHSERQYRETDSLTIADTDLLTIRIWSEIRFGRCDPWILKRSRQIEGKRYLLMLPDLPWEPDPLRENPHDRQQVLQCYRESLNVMRAVYAEISGSGPQRFARALAVVQGWLS